MKNIFLITSILASHIVMLNAKIIYRTDSLVWELSTGNNELILSHQKGMIEVLFWGAKSGQSWKNHAHELTGNPNLLFGETYCTINGFESFYNDFEYNSHKILTQNENLDVLVISVKLKNQPVMLDIIYKTFGNSGVFSREIKIINRGKAPLNLQKLPSMSIDMPPGIYVLNTLESYWGAERSLKSDTLPSTGIRTFKTYKGTSTSDFASWFCVKNLETGTSYLAQLAYSGNWQMSFSRTRDYWRFKHNIALNISMGINFDHNDCLSLSPGQSFQTPAVIFTSATGSLDDIANQMKNYHREFIVPVHREIRLLPVVFNTWYGYPLKVNVQKLKETVKLAAEIGCEIFVLDAGWYNTTDDWSADLGNWIPSKETFPNGIEELADEVNKNNMKFGLWTEIENIGKNSVILKNHPDWCFQLNGAPAKFGDRYVLNMANNQVWEWAFSELKRLIQTYHLAWLKIDNNASPETCFDVFKEKGLTLYNHTVNYYRLLDSIRVNFPNLIIENCASGAMRQDVGIMAHTYTSWVSDNIDPKFQPHLGWGASLELIPEICYYFMSGDTTITYQWLLKDRSNINGWWDYIFKVSMIGQYGISSDLTRWSVEAINVAKRNLSLYKKIRNIFVGANVYHLTNQPDYFNPQNWSIIQYDNPNLKKMLIMAHRLKHGMKDISCYLKNIVPDKKYKFIFESAETYSIDGKTLISYGFLITLPFEFNSAAIVVEYE